MRQLFLIPPSKLELQLQREARDRRRVLINYFRRKEASNV